MRVKGRKPVDGDLRTKTYFAWFPVKIYDEYPNYEWRWLEDVKIEQRFCCMSGNWENHRFL